MFLIQRPDRPFFGGRAFLFQPLRRGARILRFVVGAAGIVLFGTGGPGCSSYVSLPSSKVSPDSAILILNGEPISLEDFDSDFRLMAIHYSAVSEDSIRKMKRQLSEHVIDRRLLYQVARRKGIRVTQKEFERALSQASQDSPDNFPLLLKKQGVEVEVWKRGILLQLYVDKLVNEEVNRKIEISDSEVADYYWSHLSDSWMSDSVRARHLVVRGPAEIEKAKKRLAAGEPFEKLAADLSAGPERTEGGDWGWMPLQDLSPLYVRALSGLASGQVSGTVHDGFGYHLFQFLERRNLQMQPLSRVRKKIHDALMKAEQDYRFDQWVTGLKEKAVVQVNQDMAPLVGEIPEVQRAKKK